MNTYAQTDVGKTRDVNEDAVLATVVDDVALLIVADGMGGHAAGDVASEMAVEQIEDEVLDGLNSGHADYERLLGSAITAANRRICDAAAADTSLSGMGTTVVAALIDETSALVATVGDSRCYHIDDELTQVTTDQSLVQELVEAGEITQAEAREHPQRNVVSQALGTTEDVSPDFYRFTPTGVVLLCSDGLSEEVKPSALQQLVTAHSSLSATADALINRANENGGSDNISVVLGRHVTDPPERE